MAKYVWNRLTQCRVPNTRGLKVTGSKNLEWREEADVEIDIKSSERVDNDEKAGDDEVARRAKIIEVMKALDQDVDGDFTNDGRPKVPALTEGCGFQVTSAERDELWTEILANG
jgi:hypothetical protein